MIDKSLLLRGLKIREAVLYVKEILSPLWCREMRRTEGFSPSAGERGEIHGLDPMFSMCRMGITEKGEISSNGRPEFLWECPIDGQQHSHSSVQSPDILWLRGPLNNVSVLHFLIMGALFLALAPSQDDGLRRWKERVLLIPKLTPYVARPGDWRG